MQGRHLIVVYSQDIRHPIQALISECRLGNVRIVIPCKPESVIVGWEMCGLSSRVSYYLLV